MTEDDPISVEMPRRYWRTLLKDVQNEAMDDDEQARIYEIEFMLEEICDA